MSKTKKKALLWLVTPFACLIIIAIVAGAVTLAQNFSQSNGADYQNDYGSMSN